MNHRAAIIGLGVMGQRMLGSMASYPGFDAVCGWDPDARARERTAARYPDMALTSSAEEAIRREDVDVVYIACPPMWHRAHALEALAAGKAVYCEKPLGVDLDDSRDLARQARDSGQVNIVNFSLASAAATTAVQSWLASDEPGVIHGVDVVLHFSQWPRAWQMDAADWLSYRTEGGFTREVLSHWVYLSERLFGRAALRMAHPRYPPGGGGLAETHLQSALDIDGMPVSVLGSVGGAGPDRVEYTVWGSRSSRRVLDWNRLFASSGDDWAPLLTDIQDPREKGYELQLANAAAAVAGDAHSMPDFADALSVQELIEAMLVT
jgi:predicted dehydrogenase